MDDHRLFVLVMPLVLAARVASGSGDLTVGNDKVAPPHNGSYATRIDLGDGVALTYDSSRRNGFVGVGWRLDGVHFIERAGKSGGAPTYTASDVFLLDGGEELIADASLGGTHSTTRQTFLRITFSSAENVWRIRQTDGTEVVLGPIIAPAADKTFRWSATSSTNSHGRATTYSYWGAYLDQVVQPDGVTIQFLREARSGTDMITYANGVNLSNTQYRLKAAVVRVGGTLKRAFGLTYDATERTSMSKLATVREYGRDAVVNADGMITGSSLLRVSASYTPELGDSFTAKPDVAWCASETLVMMNHDGDSKADMHCRLGPSATGGTVRTRLSNGDGTFAAEKSWAYGASWCGLGDTLSMGGDYNGDGKQDLLCIDGLSGGMVAGTFHVATSTGAGTYSALAMWPPISRFCAVGGILESDVNGDGKTDLICRSASSDAAGSVALSTGTGTFTPVGTGMSSVWSSVLATETFSVTTGDVDGDGFRDVIFIRNTQATSGVAAKRKFRVGFSNGNGTFRLGPIWEDTYTGVCETSIAFVDQNGDGKDDLTCTRPTSSAVMYTYRWLSVGDGTFQIQSAFGWLETTATQKCSVGFGDFNGDGRNDFICSYYNATTNYYTGVHRVALTPQNGAPVQQAAWTSAFSGPAQIRLVDVNGDGRTDLVRSIGATYGAQSVEIATGSSGALLAGLTNGLGGSLEITYAPSSSWVSTYLPAGTVVQTLAKLVARDGRAGTVPITTTFSYAGANWDRIEQRFLGFRTARATDATGAYTETTFTQNVADDVGTAERIDERDASGNLYTSTSRIFSRSGNGTTIPYVSHPTETWEYACNGDTSCKSVRTTRTYDAHGNVTAEYDYGSSACGDERAITTQYAKNLTSYIVSLPWEVRVSKATCGTGCNAACTPDDIAATFTRTYYDNATSPTAAPVRGDATKVEKWLAQANRWVPTAMTYDGYGNRLAITDALGNTTTTGYDAVYHRFPLSETNALGQTTTQSWDYVCGARTSSVDPNGAVTTTTYDTLCRPTRVDHPDGSWKLTSYNDLLRGQPDAYFLQETSSDGTADGLWKKTYQDGLDRPYRVVSEPDQTVDTVYDERGLVASTSLPHATGETTRWTMLGYDAVRRPTMTMYPDAMATRTDYDDWATIDYDELGYPIRHEYDSDGQLALTTEYVADVSGYIAYATTTSSYDHLGRLIAISDAEGNDTVLTYDTMSRKTSTNDPDMGSWTYGYDDAGRMILQTDARGRAITFQYDALGRLTRKLRGATVLEQRFYDESGHGASKGRLTQVVNAASVVSFSYDVMGRATQQTQIASSEALTFGRAYDAAGRLASLTYPDGEVVTATYDSAGRLKTVGGYVTNAGYDARGSLISRTAGNGVIEQYAYDPNRLWLRHRTAASLVGPVVANMTFSYEDNGQLIARTNAVDPTDSWSYRYDSLKRVVGSTNAGSAARNQTIAYSPLGNIISQTGVGTYAYPASGMARPHAPLAAGTASFTYDANGNRLSNDGGATLSYAYDDLNRLVTADGVAYQYDGLGARVRAGDTTYVGDLYEKGPTGVTKYYTFRGARIAKRTPDGAVYYYHGDQLDTTKTLTSANGAIVGQRWHSVFGQRLAATGIADPFGIAGQREDASGLYHMGARFMDPRAGQFTQPDPSGDSDPAEPQKLNRYAYVYNRPTTMVDPTGLWGMQGNDPSDNHYNGGISGGGANASHGGSSGGNGYSGSGRDRGTRTIAYRNGYNPTSNRYNGGYIAGLGSVARAPAVTTRTSVPSHRTATHVDGRVAVAPTRVTTRPTTRPTTRTTTVAGLRINNVPVVPHKPDYSWFNNPRALENGQASTLEFYHYYPDKLDPYGPPDERQRVIERFNDFYDDYKNGVDRLFPGDGTPDLPDYPFDRLHDYDNAVRVF